MSVIILPGKFRKQPQYATPLDRGSPFHRYVAFAYSAGRGLQDGKHTGVIGSSVGTITHRYGSGGRYITPADGSSYVQFPSVDDYNVLGNITVIARVRLGTIGTQQAIAIKSASSGGIDTPFALLIESDGSVSLNRSNNAGGPSFRVWSSSAKLSAGQTAVIASTQPTDISTPPKFYIDGSFDAGTASSLYGGAGVGAAGSTTSPIQLGNRTDLASRFYGNIFDVIVFNDVFSPHAINGLSRDLDQIWRAPPRKIWLGSAVTTINLTVANAAQPNAVGSAAISQTHALTISAAASANTSSTPAITQTHILAVANSTQANAASSVAVTIGASITLVADASTQGNSASAAAITQAHILVHAPSVQDNIAASSAIVQAHILAAANAAQGNVAGAGAISLLSENNLVVSPVTQGNIAGIGQITRTQTLTVANATQGNKLSTGAISDGVIVEAALTTGIAPADKIKKPGIPVDAPAWLKTFLETLVGRRGNKIEIPKSEELTFSATPTKAECEALYAYANKMRVAIDQLITRLDS